MGSEMVVRAGGTLEPTTMDEAARLATTAAASGLFAVKRPEEALVILLTGRELGLGAMASLRGIYVVSGRPVLSADLLVACVRRSGLCRSWRVVESTATRCEITTQRVDEEHPSSKVWTAEDAKRAGLAGRGTWAAYPGQMLRHRCAADLAREVYPEVALGLYDPDEMEGVPVRTDPRTTPTLPAPAPEAAEPTEDSVEDSSRAVVEMEMSLDGATLSLVPVIWREALAALRCEGHAPEEWTPTMAAVLDAWLQTRGYALTSAQRTALMGGTMAPALASWLDTCARVGTVEEAVTLYVLHHAALEAVEASEDRVALARVVLSRRGVTAPTGAQTHAAVERLRALAAPVLAERAAAVDAVAAPPVLTARTREPGDDDDEPPPATPPRKGRRKAMDATPAPAEDVSWQGSREGMEAHAAGLAHPRAVEASAARHRTLVGYAAVLAARLVALTPPDEHGAVLSEASARARVNGWMAAAQSAARRAA